MAKPKLALIPATQGSKLYSVLPADGVGDFNFSRNTGATRINKDGLIETVASGKSRLNYPLIDGVVNGCPSHLLEPSRLQLFPYSEDFENSDWTKNAGTTITNNYATSPDGTLNASRYLGTGASGLGDKFTLSSASYTLSFYVKSNTSENQFCALLGDSSQSSGDLLVTTEWKRISHTFTGSGLSNKTNGIFRDSSNNDIDILIYGAQLEQGSYPTSYIPTSGSAVTRSAETANNSGDDQVINSTEGVLYIETSALSNDLSERRFGISDGTYSNVVRVGYTSVSNRIIAVIYNGSNQAVMTYTSSDITQKSKIAVKYKENDFALWVDGVKRSTDTSGSVFSANTLNSLDFNIGGGSHFYGETKDVRVYNTALTDAELQALTT